MPGGHATFTHKGGSKLPFTEEEIDDIFTYHAPHGNQQERYQSIREGARVFAKILVLNTQPSADQRSRRRIATTTFFTTTRTRLWKRTGG